METSSLFLFLCLRFSQYQSGKYPGSPDIVPFQSDLQMNASLQSAITPWICWLIIQSPTWVLSQQQSHWPPQLSLVEILSTADSARQKAYFYRTQHTQPQPLLVSLHSWSGDYTQTDPLLEEILARDWNYIHPDFRGPNLRPEACGSDLVISDIEDAIYYAMEHGYVDPNQIHIIGTSGGGYATLLMYMRTKWKINSFSAWVPISNLVDWYWETKSRALKYAGHILAATSSQESILNVEEAKRRSPFFMEAPFDKRKESRLRIFCGIHDGYTGSVPISQSVSFYNKLLEDLGGSPAYQVPDSLLLHLLSKRTASPILTSSTKSLGGRRIHLQKAYHNIQLTIFEGGHEMLVPAVWEYLK
ncbi:MAG: prolyl oligopeptidase family serine peptidase [Bacteroidota bacterium]